MEFTELRIHPAIGIARVGNSPSGYFVGPERRWDHRTPEGGYKDRRGRIKRQAARFRIFGYQGNEVVREVRATGGTQISWTVHLANTKAAYPKTRNAGGGPRNDACKGAARERLKIDPGPRTIVGGTDQVRAFDNGKFALGGHEVTVPLGEIRTDADGSLLVLGGTGAAKSPSNEELGQYDSDGWYDDVSDGRVTAQVIVNGQPYPVVGAWVIVAPPNFAPPVGNVIRLWDRLFEELAPDDLRSALPSYVNDVYPILQAAMDAGAVNRGAYDQHRFDHPAKPADWRNPGDGTNVVLSRVESAGNDHMPKLVSNDRGDLRLKLTEVQHRALEKWAADQLAPDPPWNGTWADGPQPDAAITPDGMDKAALENCVGGMLLPGIEAGEFLLQRGNYLPIAEVNGQPSFRLDHTTVDPGDVTAGMALPWQADFYDCDDNMWIAARPNQVRKAGTAPGRPTDQWDRAITRDDFIHGGWSGRGFVDRVNGELVETDGP